MPVLQGDEPRFERTQKGERPDDDHRRPEHGMNPERRAELGLDQNGEPHDDGTEDENYEHGRAVARILRGEVEPAGVATLRHIEQTLEKLSSAAARAAAEECDRQKRYLGRGQRPPHQ